jgi:hypothetical protein
MDLLRKRKKVEECNRKREKVIFYLFMSGAKPAEPFSASNFLGLYSLNQKIERVGM